MFFRKPLIFTKFTKIYILMTIILFFTFIYMFLDDKNFSGLNIIQELLKEELLKEKVKIEIKNKIFEGMTNLNSYNDNKYNDSEDETKEIKKAVKKVSDQIDKEEIKIKPSLLQQFFNRLYFSVSTGCLLGYGDIYPITNVAKFLSIVQAILTVSLIIY